MPKKFAIFCDGTWQSLDNEAKTNVVKLARSVAKTAADGSVQLTYYSEGVGVASRIGGLTDLGARYLGGALGRGLDVKIEQAYRFIVLNFEPDDEIFVFGFSRGAYTARSLCGLIRKCGVVRRDAFDQIPKAMANYRSTLDSDDPDMVRFRQEHTHPLSASVEDRHEVGITTDDVERARRSQSTRAELFQYRPAKTYRIAYAGIWDTVGELGVPRGFDWLGLNRQYDFHDTVGSSLISSIRHAIAANEQREFFDSTPYANIDTLNVLWASQTGWNCVDPDDPRFVPYRLRPYQQKWFPGDHGSVGGGSDETALSNAALCWIADGAEWAGLRFTDDQALPLSQARTRINAFGPLGRSGATTAPKGRTRAAGPKSRDEIADELWERMAGDPGYRPTNLQDYFGYLKEPRLIQPAPPGYPEP